MTSRRTTSTSTGSNDDDALVVQHLRWLTLMTADEMAELERAQQLGARATGRPRRHWRST